MPAATAAPLALVYLHTDQVMGWAPADAALVMALFLMLQGLVGGLIEPNLGMVIEGIGVVEKSGGKSGDWKRSS